jgi:hypothetical protein
LTTKEDCAEIKACSRLPAGREGESMFRHFLCSLLPLSAAALDAQTWRELLPLPRVWHAMAFDMGRGRTVLYGGAKRFGLLADTWEHDGTGWLRVVTALTPGQRVYHALAYDIGRARTVLFGGAGSSGELADTW